MIAISAMGWTLFVLGFGIYRNRYYTQTLDGIS